MKDEKTQEKQNVSLTVNLDTTPILYTDNILMSSNDDGVVLDISQKLANTNQLRIVARIGMSRKHAKKFLSEFGKILAITEGKRDTGNIGDN